MKEIITNSLRYWEPRRIAFNAILALVFAGYLVFYNQPPLPALGWQPAIGLLFAAVLANVLYCAAYGVDLLVQPSEYQMVWRRYRWSRWVAGTALAAGVFLFHE
jgi:hypothetical protein